MQYQDYYAVLGVPRDAGAEQIKAAYRKLARRYHPDVSRAADAEARFKEIGEAYATLRDPDRRAAYDGLGERAAGQAFTPPPHWADGFAQGVDADAAIDSMDLADLLEAVVRTRRGSRRPQRGHDIEAAVSLSLEQMHRGATLSIDLGTPQAPRQLEVAVPAGMLAGQKLRLRGKGGRGRDGGTDGDLYLDIRLLPHAQFRPDGRDLYFDLPLAPWEAALGAEVVVSTLDGPVLLTVPPGTRSGRRLRLRGHGLAGRAGAARGDLYALASIDVPTVLGARERELYQELSRVSHFAPRGTPNEEIPHGSA